MFIEKLANKAGFFKCQCCGKYLHSVETFGAKDAYGAVCKRCGWEQTDEECVNDPFDPRNANGITLISYREFHNINQ